MDTKRDTRTKKYTIGVFVKIANAESVQSKPYRVLTPILPVTTKFEQKTG